jgi:hypothetical protein
VMLLFSDHQGETKTNDVVPRSIEYYCYQFGTDALLRSYSLVSVLLYCTVLYCTENSFYCGILLTLNSSTVQYWEGKQARKFQLDPYSNQKLVAFELQNSLIQIDFFDDFFSLWR